MYNAANEVAVQAFLDGTIRFPEMAEVVERALEEIGADGARDIDDVLAADRAARTVASEHSARLGEAGMGAPS